MVVLQSSIAGLAALAALLVPQVAAQGCAAVTGRFSPRMGAGYRATVIASGLRGPRHIAFDTAGNLLVAEQQGGSVRRLKLKENGSSVCVESSNVVASGTNHGVAFSADGKTLFVSSLQSVTMYPYDATAGTVGTGKVVVTGLQTSTVHPTRAILVSKWNPDVLLVARGSNSNIDTPTTSTSAARSIIKAFSIAKISQAPVDYTSGGEVLGWGLRNIVGMGEDPMHGGIYSVENSLDDCRFGGKDVHNNNPAERLNYHGIMNETTNSLKGANFGYPSCFAAWDTASLGSGITVGSLFKPDSVPNANDCASRQKPTLSLPPHTAPLDIKFLPDGSSAFISFHGSWNRQPPDGYRVMRYDFKDGKPVASVTSTTASIPVMENTNTGSCPSACFRPVGLALDSKNRLYVSSDTSGEIYLITSS